MTLTLDQLKAKLPAAMPTLADQYGPAILAMGQDKLNQWINFVFVGDTTAAYALYLASVGDADLLSQWQKANADWTAANEKNADQIAMSKAIATAVCKAMLAIVLAAAGL